MLAFFKKQPIDWHFFVKLLRITFKVIDIVRKKGRFKNDFLSYVLQIRRLCHLHFKYCKYEWMKVTRLQLWLCKIAILPPRNLLSWILKANFSKVSLYGTKYPSQQWTLFSNMTVAQGLLKVKIQKAFSKITENT